MLHAIIIAGGLGKRLWPKSRLGSPKFLLKPKGKKTLLEEAIDRARGIIPLKNILIVTNKEHVVPVRKELPKFPKGNIIAEPVSRNTAPAICLAAFFVKKKDPNGVIFVMPADQKVSDEAAMKEILGLASLLAHIKASIITIGVKPTFAATGYGYIKTASLYKRLASDTKYKYDVYKVGKFIEKPSLARAKSFFRSGGYLWNSGIFIGKAGVFLNEFKRYKPSLYRVSEKIEKGLGTKRERQIIERNYKNFEDISIDYAIMQKTKIAYAIKADISWQDIGSWRSFKDVAPQDASGNAVIADYIGIDTKNSVIVGEKGHLIAVLGADSIVIVQTKDATLVCSKDRTEDVKKIVELLKKKGLKRYL